MTALVVPAYDEAPNVPGLMAGLAPLAHELGARTILVDDGSTDGTADAIHSHSGGLDVEIVRHERNRGVGAALDSGLRAALAGADDGEAIVTLEADTTSDLSDVPRMLALLDRGNDVVLASVWAPGGRVSGVAPWRVWASRSVSRGFRLIGGPPGVHTYSSLFRAYRAGALRRAADGPGGALVREQGFAASVELLLRLHRAGARIAEIPTVNDWSGRAGTSKLSLRPTAHAYLRLMRAQIAGRI
jgi:dolichol-phosphate mannosyltransferase